MEDQDPPTPGQGGPGTDDDLWLVSFSDDDDRELTTAEVVGSLKRGEITLSSLVWREGMVEWQPIANIDGLRGPAGLLMKPFQSDAPPARDSDPPESGESMELSSSDMISSPPMSLADADFLGLEDPDTSMSPPSIEHAAFFMSNPPPSAKKGVLPSLPSLGRASSGRSSTPISSAASSSLASSSLPSSSLANSAQSKGGSGSSWKWLPLVAVAAAAAMIGYLSVEKEAPPPPMPAQTSLAANPPSPAQDEPAPVAAPPADVPPAAEQPAQGAPTTAASEAQQPAANQLHPAAPANAATAPAQQKAPAPETPQPQTTAVPAAVAPTTAAAPAASPKPATARPTSTAAFDKAAASAALNAASARASACRSPSDPSGTAEVSVTFSSSGRATQALINGPPFRGTATGSCIAREMRNAQVPPFAGDFVTVHKVVVIR